MSDYRRAPTTKEVWAVIHASHPDLKVFGSYSAPDGDRFGNPSQGKMFTSYGLDGGDYPLIEAETTWDIDAAKTYKRNNERHQFWLCLPIKEAQ